MGRTSYGGRGFGRGGGRGRGNGRGRGGGRSNDGGSKATNLMLFHPVTAGKYTSYHEVCQAVIRQVYKTIKNSPADVEQTIKESTQIDFKGTKPDKATYKTDDGSDWKDDTAKDEYEHALDKWRKRSEVYEANIRKTAAFVFDNFCTETMRDRLVSKLDAEDLHDLTLLMPAIQQLMHTVHKAEHPMKKVWGDVRKLLDCKQQPGETHDQYVNKIIDQRRLITARMGTKWLNGVVRLNYAEEVDAINSDATLTVQERTEAIADLCLKKHDEAFAMLVILNSDQQKYGSLVRNLEGQYGRGTNQYPQTIADAKDALHTHYWDKLPNKKNKDKNKNSDKKDKNASNTSFYERSEAKSGLGVCFKCGGKGHKANECTKAPKKLDYKDWWISKVAHQHLTMEESDSDSNSDESSVESKKPKSKSKKGKSKKKKKVGGGQF